MARAPTHSLSEASLSVAPVLPSISALARALASSDSEVLAGSILPAPVLFLYETHKVSC